MRSTTPPQPPTVGLISPCGWGNLGDAAIVAATIESIRTRIPDADIFALTQNPEDTTRRHQIPAYPLAAQRQRNSYSAERNVLGRALMRARLLFRSLRSEAHHIATCFRLAKSADLLVVAGGGQLDDYWGGAWSHPYDLLKWACAARLAKTPVVVLSVGYGTKPTRLSTLLLRAAMKMAAYHSFRDRRTIGLVRERLGLGRAAFSPDMAFALSVQATDREERSDHRLVVGLSPIAYGDPRSWPVKDAALYSDYLDKLATFVDWLRSQGHRVIFFCTDTMDVHSLRDLHRRCGPPRHGEQSDADRPEPYYKDLADLASQLSLCDVVVASRLHGVILSHRLAKPVLAISYDWKVATHMQQVEESRHVLDIQSLDTASLISKFESLAADRHDSRLRLRGVSAEYFRSAQQQFDVVISRFLGVPTLRTHDSATRANTIQPVPNDVTTHRE